MILFPPLLAVTVLIEGVPVHSYRTAYVLQGRTYAPVRPYLTLVADRVWHEGNELVAQRGGRTIRVLFFPSPGAVPPAYVPIAPILRALGASVRYAGHRVLVSLPARPIVTPTPFDPAAPSSPPREVFTPTPPPMPRFHWTGTPLPRRTPIPVIAPTPAGSLGSLWQKRKPSAVSCPATLRSPKRTKPSSTSQSASQITTDVPVTIGADDSVEETMRTMMDHKVRRLPVIDGHKLIGVVSQADVAQAVSPEQAGRLLAAISR